MSLRIAVSILASAAFGAAVGCYVGRLQILFAAVKMPLFLLGTLLLSFPAMHLFALVAAPRLRMADTFDLALGSVATTARGLGALSPVVAFLSLTSPIPSYKTYLFLVLVLVGSIALSGTISLRQLRRDMERLDLGPAAPRLFAAWLAIYGFAGSQVAWLLRPWVGSSYAVRGYFSIYRNLEGNFYEAVFRAAIALVS
ncbi:MAG: hypothetical protein HYY17_00380 [Planctomycetes bacterium]|nr:hypothetical protein [Planctomycetota bacterium]